METVFGVNDLMEEIAVYVVKCHVRPTHAIPFFAVRHAAEILIPLRTINRAWYRFVHFLLGSWSFWNRILPYYGLKEKLGTTHGLECFRMTPRAVPLVAQRLIESLVDNPKAVLSVHFSGNDMKYWGSATAVAIYLKVLFEDWFSGMTSAPGMTPDDIENEYLAGMRYMANLTILANRINAIVRKLFSTEKITYMRPGDASAYYLFVSLRQLCSSVDDHVNKRMNTHVVWNNLLARYTPSYYDIPDIPRAEEVNKCLYVYVPLFHCFRLVDNYGFHVSPGRWYSGDVGRVPCTSYSYGMAALLYYVANGYHWLLGRDFHFSVDEKTDPDDYRFVGDFVMGPAKLKLSMTITVVHPPELQAVVNAPELQVRIVRRLEAGDICCSYCRASPAAKHPAAS